MRKNAKKGKTLFGLLAVLAVVCASRGAMAAELPAVASGLPVGIAAYTTILVSDFGQKLLDGMVGDGVITEEQANAIKTDWTTNIKADKSANKAIEERSESAPAKNKNDSENDSDNEDENDKDDESKKRGPEESERKFGHFSFKDLTGMMMQRRSNAGQFNLSRPDFNEFVEAGIIDQETADKMTEYIEEKYGATTYNPFTDLVEKGIIDEETAENMLEYLRELLAKGEGILELPTIDRGERPIFKWEFKGIPDSSTQDTPESPKQDTPESPKQDTPESPSDSTEPSRNIRPGRKI